MSKLTIEIGQHDRCAVLGKQPCSSKAHALGRTCHERDLTLEVVRWIHVSVLLARVSDLTLSTEGREGSSCAVVKIVSLALSVFS
ncbi:hypothetical protein [Mesorhizobium sp. Cs1321R2N1]|uniref:hypothetical protein n=1 Tax=Mesorhizobium sp. Cs1321R2N1 TaxID=3015174 RepID=UPI00301C9034